MSELANIANDNTIRAVPTMTLDAIRKVRVLESEFKKLTQVPLVTTHIIHAGIYSRTVTVPAGVTITGALIKRSTMLMIVGHGVAYIGEEAIKLEGAHLITARAPRKQAFHAVSDLQITMSFATNATTVEEAEAEFTDEADLLCSRQPYHTNRTIITKE